MGGYPRPRSKFPGLGFVKRLYSNSSPLRRVFLVLGTISFVTGVVLVGVGLYGLATEDTEERPFRETVDVGQFTPSPSPRSTVTAAPPTPAPTPPFANKPYRFIIEKLGVNAPVGEYGLDDQSVPEVPTGDNAKEIVAWYNFSAQPGTGSNAVYAGHVTWFGEAVFFRLTSLVAGDIVRLRGDDGMELVYTVTDVFAVDPNDPDSLKVMGATDKDAITIITCDGAFVDTADPIFGGEYSNRLIVRAERDLAPAPAAAGG